MLGINQFSQWLIFVGKFLLENGLYNITVLFNFYACIDFVLEIFRLCSFSPCSLHIDRHSTNKKIGSYHIARIKYKKVKKTYKWLFHGSSCILISILINFTEKFVQGSIAIKVFIFLLKWQMFRRKKSTEIQRTETFLQPEDRPLS